MAGGKEDATLILFDSVEMMSELVTEVFILVSLCKTIDVFIWPSTLIGSAAIEVFILPSTVVTVFAALICSASFVTKIRLFSRSV